MIVSGNNFENNKAQYAAGGKFVGARVVFSKNKYTNNKASVFGNDAVNECVYGQGKLSDDTCESCPSGSYSVSDSGGSC